MNRNQQIVALLVLNLFLYAVIAELNFYLTRAGVYLNLDLLLVIFAAMRLRIVHGLVFVLIIGLTSGAVRPEPPGATMLFLAVAWFLCLLLRPRIRRENPLAITAIAVVLQAALLLGYTIIYSGHLLHFASVWQRALSDSVVSLLVLALVTNRWCEFQRRVLLIMGWDLNAESQRI